MTEMGVELTRKIRVWSRNERKRWREIVKVTMCYPDSLELSDFAAFLRLQEGADLPRGVARGFLFDKERNQDNKNQR